MQIRQELGGVLGEKAVAALGVAPAMIQSYGKAAIVGEAGELEHAAAILHPRLGKPLRQAVEKGAALVPSAARRWAASARRSTCRSGTRTRPSYAAISMPFQVRVPDAPRADEIVVAVAVTDSGRPLPRIGGLSVDQIEGKDGLR